MNENGCRVLRCITGIDEMARRNIDHDGHLIEEQDKSLWVDNDQPWDFEIGQYVMQATSVYKVVDRDGNRIYGPVRDLNKAEAARSSAKVTVVSYVEDVEDDTDLVAAAASNEAEADKD